MFRIKDFLLMDVIDIKGKKIGFIKDLLIDFHKFEVKGFLVCSYRIFQKNVKLYKEDIISFNKFMIIKSTGGNGAIEFSQIKSMDIVDTYGEIVGMVEDIIFEEGSYRITGIVVSTGLIKNMLCGKKILLPQDLMLGEESILHFDINENLKLMSVPHKIDMEVDCHEEEI